MMLVLIFAFTAGGVAHHIVGLSLLIRALLKMLCQRALLKMPSQLIRALLKMKTGAAKTSSAENAVPANTSSSQDADPATSFYPTILSLLNSSLSYDAISHSTLLKIH